MCKWYQCLDGCVRKYMWQAKKKYKCSFVNSINTQAQASSNRTSFQMKKKIKQFYFNRQNVSDDVTNSNHSLWAPRTSQHLLALLLHRNKTYKSHTIRYLRRVRISYSESFLWQRKSGSIVVHKVNGNERTSTEIDVRHIATNYHYRSITVVELLFNFLLLLLLYSCSCSVHVFIFVGIILLLNSIAVYMPSLLFFKLTNIFFSLCAVTLQKKISFFVLR